ncbi:MAG: hypothetical protein Ct9H300mP4_04330 [Gammaproteobacteria bacterium]|nr:MAG: hypothetical protein Ct9H300mP4_04330 [Gammaproteobacteria bacterium]
MTTGRYRSASEWDIHIQLKFGFSLFNAETSNGSLGNLNLKGNRQTSIGFVLTPVDGLTITGDYWTIEKKEHHWPFWRNNHTVYDSMLRWANGTSNCGSFPFGNPAVVREAPDEDDLLVLPCRVCPFGNL